MVQGSWCEYENPKAGGRILAGHMGADRYSTALVEARLHLDCLQDQSPASAGLPSAPIAGTIRHRLRFSTKGRPKGMLAPPLQLTIRYFFAGFYRGPGAVSPE